MKEYDVNHLGLLINGECINLGCFVDLIKDKPINMEQYIASYKHLIGCEHIHGRGLTFYFTDKSIESIVGGFDINKLRFYLDDESLGTYQEYMQLHYPEYVHVWSQQL